MKKRGFTLAEVLISLGIIGVVSAITMPALTANYQKKTYEAQIKKAYNTISVAIQTYMAQEGVDNLQDSALVQTITQQATSVNQTHQLNERQKALDEFATKYLKVAQDCNGVGTKIETTSLTLKSISNNCFASSYKSLDRQKSSNFATMNIQTSCGLSKNGPVQYNLTDGSSWCLSAPNTNKDNVLYLIVDTNGKNGPNIAGRDLFKMNVRADGLVYDTGWKNYVDKPDTWPGDIAKGTAVPLGIGKLMADGWQMNY